jgi:uncharacterized membrane protein
VNGQEQYFVVAADGKEYGPADLETLRQWVREGRVVKATHIKKGSGGITFAGKLPELVDLFPPKEPAVTTSGQAPPPQPMPSTVTLPSEFRVWEFISLGWDIVKPHWIVLAGMFFIQVAIGAVPYLGGCVQFIIGGAIMVGIWRALLGMLGGRKPDVGMMFQGFDRFGDAFLAGLISGILIGLGFICLIVPGVILAIMWLFTYPVIAETGLGFWEAMRESSRLTEGYRWRLFLLLLACLLISIVGFLVFCVGLFVALPVNFTALALAYRFLQSKKVGSAPVPATT